MKKRIVITGATGMIGVALARFAIESGDEVLAIVRPDSGKINNLPKDSTIKVCKCKLSQYDTLKLNETYDTFFHLAWDLTAGSGRNDIEAQCTNIQYTMDAVKLANRLGCSTFVGVGSQAEYGLCCENISATTSVNPESGYGIAKYAAGKMSGILCEQLNMKHCWARVLSVYGIHDNPKTLIMYCISQLLQHQTPLLTECNQIWDYLYCDDAARALYMVGEKGTNREIYCIGSGRSYPLREYLEMLQKVIDIDLPLGFGKKEYSENQVMYLSADISNLKKDTGFVPEISFEDGIRRTIEWYRGNV